MCNCFNIRKQESIIIFFFFRERTFSSRKKMGGGGFLAYYFTHDRLFCSHGPERIKIEKHCISRHRALVWSTQGWIRLGQWASFHFGHYSSLSEGGGEKSAELKIQLGVKLARSLMRLILETGNAGFSRFHKYFVYQNWFTGNSAKEICTSWNKDGMCC